MSLSCVGAPFDPLIHHVRQMLMGAGEIKTGEGREAAERERERDGEEKQDGRVMCVRERAEQAAEAV